MSSLKTPQKLYNSKSFYFLFQPNIEEKRSTWLSKIPGVDSNYLKLAKFFRTKKLATENIPVDYATTSSN